MWPAGRSLPMPGLGPDHTCQGTPQIKWLLLLHHRAFFGQWFWIISVRSVIITTLTLKEQGKLSYVWWLITSSINRISCWQVFKVYRPNLLWKCCRDWFKPVYPKKSSSLWAVAWSSRWSEHSLTDSAVLAGFPHYVTLNVKLPFNSLYWWKADSSETLNQPIKLNFINMDVSVKRLCCVSCLLPSARYCCDPACRNINKEFCKFLQI